jgi:hypothetical protein
MTCGFKLKWVALVGGSTIQEWKLVATSANNSRSDVVKSTFQALASSSFLALASWYPTSPLDVHFSNCPPSQQVLYEFSLGRVLKVSNLSFGISDQAYPTNKLTKQI